MSNFTINIATLEEFVSTHRVMYASGNNKRLYITLTNLFVVVNQITKEEFAFDMMTQAVDCFNRLQVVVPE